MGIDNVSLRARAVPIARPQTAVYCHVAPPQQALLRLTPLRKFMFYSNDPKGQRQIGRETMVDGSPLIRIDGPHAAPCQHIGDFNTVMLVGAGDDDDRAAACALLALLVLTRALSPGIGLTPFSSTLTSLLKYKTLQISALVPRVTPTARPQRRLTRVILTSSGTR